MCPRIWAVSAALAALALGTAWADEGVCVAGDLSCSATPVEAQIVLRNGADEALNVYVTYRAWNKTRPNTTLCREGLSLLQRIYHSTTRKSQVEIVRGTELDGCNPVLCD